MVLIATILTVYGRLGEGCCVKKRLQGSINLTSNKPILLVKDSLYDKVEIKGFLKIIEVEIQSRTTVV